MALIQDKSSREWLQVKAFCEERLFELQIENEGPLDIVDTAVVRGKIEFIREILALEIDTAKPLVPDTSYIE